MLGGPQCLFGRVRKISPPPGFDLQTVQPAASRSTDWAVPALGWTSLFSVATGPPRGPTQFLFPLGIGSLYPGKQNLTTATFRRHCLVIILVIIELEVKRRGGGVRRRQRGEKCVFMVEAWIKLCDIARYRRCELNSSVFWVIMQRQVVWNRRFGTTCLPYLRVKLVKK